MNPTGRPTSGPRVARRQRAAPTSGGPISRWVVLTVTLTGLVFAFWLISETLLVSLFSIAG